MGTDPSTAFAYHSLEQSLKKFMKRIISQYVIHIRVLHDYDRLGEEVESDSSLAPSIVSPAIHATDLFILDCNNSKEIIDLT